MDLEDIELYVESQRTLMLRSQKCQNQII